MRVTNQYIVNSFINQINRNNSALSSMQIKVSSGKKYIKASENPVDNALAMQHKTEVFEGTQYKKNIEHTQDWYNNIDASLTTMESTLQRIRELAVQGANDTLVQEDRDAIAEELDQLVGMLVDVGNTSVAGEYIFSGHDVDKRPFEILDGQTPGKMNGMVTFSLGDVRDKINLNNPLEIAYYGDDKRMTTEIERGSIIEKSISGQELFFGTDQIVPTPDFTYTLPPLEESLYLTMLNNGRGVQDGIMVVTDHNGVDHKIDISPAHRLDDVIGIINATGSFEAGIEEVPSDTASALGLYRNAGESNTLIGISDPKMLSEFTNLSDLNNGLGVADGYLNINTRDGRNFRVDITGANTVGDVLTRINALEGGTVLKATFDMIHKRIDIKDTTGGAGNLSIQSTKSQLYLKDLDPHVAQDLGLLQNVGGGNVMFSDYDSDLESEATPFQFLNGGKGIEAGYVDITGHDGVVSRIDLTTANTPQDVVDAINAQAGGNQTAAFDPNSKRIQITDNTVGANDFKIEEVFGTNDLSVREITTVVKSLGLLKSAQGNAIVGDIIAPGQPASTLLSTLTPPPERGFLVLRGADDVPVEVDLTGANTIQDVVDGINNTGKFEASWDSVNGKFLVSDPGAASGEYGIRIEEKTNAARDLGFITGSANYAQKELTGAPIAVKALPTLTGGLDLDPAVTKETELEALNSSRTFNSGVNLGYIRITDKAGHFQAIDLRGCKTVGDVMDKINDPANGLYVEARINKDQNGLEIVDKNNGAPGKLQIIDIDSTSAADLGILGNTVDTNIVGKDIDPGLRSSTPVSALNVNNGGVPLGKVYIQSGDFSGEIDLSGCKTVGEMLDKLSNSDNRFNLQAWVSEDGSKINLTNTKGQPYIKVRDMGGDQPNTASSLGLGSSPSMFSNILDLRDNLLRNDPDAISFESLKKLDEDLERVLKLHAEVGAKYNRVDAAKEKQENLTLNLKEMLSSVEDIDMAEAITRMTELETAYQAALQTGSRVLQTTLLDFLR